MRIYDTLTATKKTFEPLGSPVKIYFCGLTPKNYPHIGHAKCVVTADVMRRYLRYRGYDVLFVQNFTDIDDKTIAKAQQEGVTFDTVADRYTEAYFQNMDTLNCWRADRYPKATMAIPGIIDMAVALIAKDYAYAVGGNVYYRVNRFVPYGRLSKRGAGDNQVGAGLRTRRVSEPTAVADGAVIEDAGLGLEADEAYMVSVAADAVDEATSEAEKADPRDFALWKASKPGEPSWESPWGPGRPAWHIECSAMIYEELGERIDIHGGGQDLIFPHHENEIAQSEAFTGSPPFVNFWVHVALLNITTPEGGTQKMAHSLGNFTTVNSILERYEPAVLRLYLLSQHYRTPATYDGSVLDETKAHWDRLRAAYSNMALMRAWPPYAQTEAAEPVDMELTKNARRVRDSIPASRALFEAGMDDDFNTSRAIVALFDLVSDLNRLKDGLSSPQVVTPSAKSVLEEAFAAIQEMMDVLGLPEPQTGTGATAELSDQVEQLLERRRQLREERDFAGADGVRAELEQMGVIVEDHPQGTIWRLQR